MDSTKISNVPKEIAKSQRVYGSLLTGSAPYWSIQVLIERMYLRRHDGSKFNNVAERYIEDSLETMKDKKTLVLVVIATVSFRPGFVSIMMVFGSYVGRNGR